MPVSRPTTNRTIWFPTIFTPSPPRPLQCCPSYPLNSSWRLLNLSSITFAGKTDEHNVADTPSREDAPGARRAASHHVQSHHGKSHHHARRANPRPDIPDLVAATATGAGTRWILDGRQRAGGVGAAVVLSAAVAARQHGHPVRAAADGVDRRAHGQVQ